jgi:hypothetical protein
MKLTLLFGLASAMIPQPPGEPRFPARSDASMDADADDSQHHAQLEALIQKSCNDYDELFNKAIKKINYCVSLEMTHSELVDDIQSAFNAMSFTDELAKLRELFDQLVAPLRDTVDDTDITDAINVVQTHLNVLMVKLHLLLVDLFYEDKNNQVYQWQVDTLRWQLAVFTFPEGLFTTRSFQRLFRQIAIDNLNSFHFLLKDAVVSKELLETLNAAKDAIQASGSDPIKFDESLKLFRRLVLKFRPHDAEMIGSVFLPQFTSRTSDSAIRLTELLNRAYSLHFSISMPRISTSSYLDCTHPNTRAVIDIVDSLEAIRMLRIEAQILVSKRVNAVSLVQALQGVVSLYDSRLKDVANAVNGIVKNNTKCQKSITQLLEFDTDSFHRLVQLSNI